VSVVLKVFLICSLLAFLSAVLYFLGKKRLSLKYSLTWLAAIISMLVVTIFPQIITFIARMVGVELAVNAVFLFSGMFMVLILMSLTFIVSGMRASITKMAQAIALLEQRVRAAEEREGEGKA
jgi:hypothetical protein